MEFRLLVPFSSASSGKFVPPNARTHEFFALGILDTGRNASRCGPRLGLESRRRGGFPSSAETPCPDFGIMLPHPSLLGNLRLRWQRRVCFGPSQEGLLLMGEACSRLQFVHMATPFLRRMARFASCLNFGPRRIGSRTTSSALIRRTPSFSRKVLPRSPWNETNSS